MIRGSTRAGVFVAIASLFGALAGLLLVATPPAPIASPRAGQSEEPSKLTDTRGHFRFDGLRRSSHVLRLDAGTLPPDIQPRGAPAVMTLSPGASQALAVAPGLLLRATYQDDGAALEGALFFDHDGDQRQGPGEPGLAAVRIVDPDIYQYFVPFNDDNLHKSFADVLVPSGCLVPAPRAPSNTTASTISLTASANNTIVYYDHWEDGYDPDPLAPGATTEALTLNAGGVQTWRDNVPAPRSSTTALLHDGRDRITIVGPPASVVRAAWLTDPGTLLAGAWEMPKVSDWSRSYIIPVGEDLGRGGTQSFADFDYVSISIMAAYDGTFVQIDADADGTFEQTATLNTGQAVPVFGTVDPLVVSIHSGGRIEASLPVQVQARAGNCRAAYSGRSYTLVPSERWTNDYWSPVAGFFNGANGCQVRYDPAQPNASADVDIYMFNPNSSPLDVNYAGANGTGTITIPPNETRSYLQMIAPPPPAQLARSNTMGVHLYASAPFWAVTASDTTSLGNNGADFDWSYTLLPANELSSRVVLSWAPGNAATPPTSDVNGSTVFVQATSNDPAGTIVKVDLDGDGQPDRFDINGDGDALDTNAYGYDETTSDQGVRLLEGQMVRVSDPVDHDMTGASISSQDNNHHLAVVYGEDACRATRADPFLDLGYTVLPLPVPVFSKNARLVTDADRSGDASPGDTLQYTVVANNNGSGPIQQPIILDTLPYTYTSFVVGSLTTSHVLASPVIYYDANGVYSPPGPPGTPDPNIHAFQATYIDLPQGDTIEITFLAVLHDVIPPDVTSVTNYVSLSSTNTPTLRANATTPINQVDLLIHKTDNLLQVQPLDQISYTLTYTNAGPGIAYNAVMTDTFPATAINVSTPTIPGVITPTILSDRIVFELGTLQPKQTGQTSVTLTLGPGTTGQVVNSVEISTSSAETDYTNNTSTDIDQVPAAAVVLSELRADRLSTGVLVAWQTVAELDHYGFHVYRAATSDRATAIRITPALIPAQGHGGGARYSFFDADAPDGPLYYWVEDIDLYGVSTFHGPAVPDLQSVRSTMFLPLVATSR